MILVPETRTVEIREPANGETLGVVITATATAIGNAVRSARDYQKQWAALGVDERVRLIRAWQNRLVQHGNELAELVSRENGKPYHEALLHEVVALADTLDYIVTTAPELQRPQALAPRWLKHRVHRIARRPRGITAILAPFNFPLLIPGADAAAALAMGCCAILKPSLACPLVAERLVSLAREAGIPAPVLQILHGDDTVGQALVASDVDEVLFTGSTANGRKVARQCGEDLKSCQLELGGNCPLLVLPGSDLDRTAHAILCGTFTNSGQSCLAVGRVLVPSQECDALLEMLKPALLRFKQGDPRTRTVDLGALTTSPQLERCRRHVRDATSRGGLSYCAPSAEELRGNFFPPTLLRLNDVESVAFQNETFGPVLPVLAYADVESAVHLLNHSRWGLAAYVFGRDLERAEAVAAQLDYGHVVVDQVLYTYVCPEIPLAGLRDSGFGVTHGTDGLLSHTQPTVLGTRKLRLPSSLEFDWNDPSRATSIAEGILATRSMWSRLRKFTGAQD
jgi:succinate-semialdehyde dehydrogenase/glutarate-semialdehyde dehydrogenase